MAVWPDECMPVDEFGNVADIIQFGGSTLNRMANGQLHEQLIGAVGRDVIKRIRRVYGIGDFDIMDFDDIKRIVMDRDIAMAKEQFDYILGWYKIISTDTDYPRALKMLDQGERWINHLCHVIEDGNDPKGMFIHLPPNSKVRMDEVIRQVKEDPAYMPEMSALRYKWPGDDEYTVTVGEHLIGPTYYLPLEKTATDWSGVSSSNLGHFGTPAKLTQLDKYTKPGRETGTKATGEDEFRNLAKTFGGEVLAEIADMHNNPVSHRAVCRAIITADKPTNIEEAIDREKYPIGGHRPLSYIQHMSLCSGKGFSRK